MWDAAAAAAKHFEALAVDRHRCLTFERALGLEPSARTFSSVLELGAGTGLAGLATAAVLQLPTVLTDLPEVLPALRRNIAANPSLAQLVTAQALDWTQPHASPALRSAGSSRSGSSSSRAGGRLVVAADCVWLEAMVSPFVDALQAAAAGPGDWVLLAYQSRSARVDDLLFDLLGRRFSMTTADRLSGEPPRGPIDLYWLLPKQQHMPPVLYL